MRHLIQKSNLIACVFFRLSSFAKKYSPFSWAAMLAVLPLCHAHAGTSLILKCVSGDGAVSEIFRIDTEQVKWENWLPDRGYWVDRDCNDSSEEERLRQTKKAYQFSSTGCLITDDIFYSTQHYSARGYRDGDKTVLVKSWEIRRADGAFLAETGKFMGSKAKAHPIGQCELTKDPATEKQPEKPAPKRKF